VGRRVVRLAHDSPAQKSARRSHLARSNQRTAWISQARRGGNLKRLDLLADRHRLFRQLEPVLFEVFAKRLERAAAGRVLVTLSTRFSGLGSKFRFGIGRSRNSHGQRSCDQYCGRRAANKDEGFFCMHIHIVSLLLIADRLETSTDGLPLRAWPLFFNKLSTRISSFLLAKSAVGNVDSDQVAFG
jgi:hypothetical protein